MSSHLKLCLFLLTLFCLSKISVCAVADGALKFEGIFLGEGLGWCNGTYAKVDASDVRVEAREEGRVEAIVEGIVELVEDVKEKQTPSAVYAAAEASAKLVLPVVATAVAMVKADINSPDEGCWAIAFGQAEAIAIAEATVTAVATAFAQVQLDAAVVELVAETVETDLQMAISRVALLLADGSGLGTQTENRTAIAHSEALAINCALGKAFAMLTGDEAQAIAYAQAGCVVPKAVPNYELLSGELVGCPCVSDSKFGVPTDCGQYGDVDNGDYICYVQDPNSPRCLCAQRSKRYSNEAWRYCGPTLETMQYYLANKTEITEQDLYNGFCPEWNYKEDVLVTPVTPEPAPAPTPTPTPTRPTKIVEDCPIIRCFGDIQSCCGVQEDECISTFGRLYVYEGECEKTGQQVWSRRTRRQSTRSFYSCACV